jgi:3-hydroxy-9,10-secoandrosta-1,3,5(10)-triene-9,17-dione monooxygenase reductase component
VVSDTWELAPDDSSAFRTVMGCFATGVTIVTAVDQGEPVGMACNSFTSVSLDPPLVLFCPAVGSSTWPRIQSAGSWCVNILAEHSEDLCRLFATPGADRFGPTAWHTGVTGAPILEDAIAYIDCEAEAEYPGGDHVIAVGRVRQMGYKHGALPLLFHRGAYGRFA